MKKIYSSVFSLLAFIYQVQGQVSFADKVILSLDYQPIQMAVGDLNADGKSDVVITWVKGTSGISIHQNKYSSGDFDVNALGQRIDLVNLNEPQEVAIADLDLDGKNEIITTNSNGTVSVYRNVHISGDLSSASFTRINYSSTAGKLFVEDIDGDGKKDIIASGSSFSVLRNTSQPGAITASSFSTRTDFNTNITQRGFCVADLDGDGKKDVIVGGYSGFYLQIYRNKGVSGVVNSSTFDAPIYLDCGGRPINIKSSDINGDLKPDLVITLEFNVSAIPFGTAIIQNKSVIGTLATSSFDVFIPFISLPSPNDYNIGDADLNFDGKIDLVALLPDGFGVSLNAGLSGPITLNSLENRIDFYIGSFASEVVVHDMNGDGAQDILCISRINSGSAISVYINTNTNNQSCSLSVAVSPVLVQMMTGSNAVFTANSSEPSSTFQWQTNPAKIGWQNIVSNGDYSGANTSTLTVNILGVNNHRQPFRVIATRNNCIDTSGIATIQLLDSCLRVVNDTNLITVTDTLVIRTIVGLQPNTQVNSIRIFPNPSNSIVNIDFGNFSLLAGHKLKIWTSLGQSIYATDINQASAELSVSDFGGPGLYFVHIIDPQGNILTVRKILVR